MVGKPRAKAVVRTARSRNLSRPTRVAARVTAAILVLLLPAAGAGAQTYQVLHSFTGTDGAHPRAPLVEAADGYFYGTAELGGQNNHGVVFKMDASGNVTVLHHFVILPGTNGGGGVNPKDGLIQAADGSFYGTAYEGSANGPYSFGTAFKITSGGVFSVLHSFGPSDDPRWPQASVIQATDGKFYGTADGGHFNRGAVFNMTGSGSVTVLHAFTQNGTVLDGSQPRARLIQAADGNFYGTTRIGGDPNAANVTFGTVFKITAAGVFTRLHSFAGTDGSQPLGALIQATDGYFYGTTVFGGQYGHGTVFRISAFGDFTVLHSFTGLLDGRNPYAGLLQATDGYFYGTTYGGGAEAYGTVFKMDASGSITVVHSFSFQPAFDPASDGIHPVAPVIQAADGSFYGTTLAGGSQNKGVVFRLDLGLSPGSAPTAVNDSYSTSVNTTLTVVAPGVLANDNTNGGGTMTTQLVTNVANGTLGLAADGGFTYTPTIGFSGTDSFTYRAVNTIGASNIATVAITINAGPPTAQPPTGLYASAIVGNTVTLRWTPPTTGLTPTGYALEGGINPGQVLASIATGSTSPILTVTAPTGAFYVRIHTLSGANKSVPSNEIRLFVNVPVVPSAPGNLLGLVNGSTLSLAWHNSFVGGAPTSLQLDVSGSIVTTLPLPLGEAFSFAGVPGGTYTLRVRATNATGTSGPSNPVTVSFPGGCSGPPLAPANVFASKSGNVVTVVWGLAASGPAPTSFVLTVTGSFVGAFSTTQRSLSGAVGPGSYTIRVYARNACGNSASTVAQTVVIP